MVEFLELDEVSRPDVCFESHLYHKECLQEVAEFNKKTSKKNKCAMCRKEFNFDKLIHLTYKGLEHDAVADKEIELADVQLMSVAKAADDDVLV